MATLGFVFIAVACASNTTLFEPGPEESDGTSGGGGRSGDSDGGGSSIDMCTRSGINVTSTEAFDQVLCMMERDFRLTREQLEVMNWGHEGESLNTEGRYTIWGFFLRERGNLLNSFFAALTPGRVGARRIDGTEELRRLNLSPEECPPVEVLDSGAMLDAVARHPWGVTRWEERQLLLGHGCGLGFVTTPNLFTWLEGGPGCQEVVEFSPQGEVIGICEVGRCFGTGLDRADCCCEPF